jgi:hypothetical protein
MIRFLKCLFKLFLKHKVVILLLILNTSIAFSQIKETDAVRFVLTDNAFNNEKNSNLYILYKKNNSTDTIFPRNWDLSRYDTIYFNVNAAANPVMLELTSENEKKQSQKFNILPKFTYNLTILDDKLIVKSRPLIFDFFDPNAKLLYIFLIKLIIELLIAIPVAALLRLPARLLFFVFVANIMTFPLLYVSFVSPEIKELAAIVLEGLIIFLIGWKRLKIHKALLVSLIINVGRFGVAKVVMLIFRIM